jgi:uncharacterized protein DUF3987
MNPDFPPFPAHALVPIQRDMAEAVAEILAIPPELPYCCVLAATSAACGRALLTPSGPGRKLGANTYHLLAAPSGLGKSSIFRSCFEPLYALQASRYRKFCELDQPALILEQTKLKADFEIYKKNLGKKGFIPGQEDKIKLIIARLAEIEFELHSPQIICEDITGEALAVALAANREQIFSLSADADKVFCNVEGRYVPGKELDESVYVKGFSRDSLWQNRISRPNIYLENPCLTICWMTQALRLDRLFANREFREGGLLPRFLIVARNPPIAEIPDQIPPLNHKLQMAYQQMIMNLLNNFWDSPSEILLPESLEVYERLRSYYNSLVPRMNGQDCDIASFIKRWQEYAWRLSLVLHAAQHQVKAPQIPLALPTAEAAIQIVNWHAQEQLRILEPKRESFLFGSFRKLAAFLQRQTHWQATTRQIKRNFGWTTAQLDKVLAGFSQYFSRRTQPPSKRGGRPSEIIQLLKTHLSRP